MGDLGKAMATRVSRVTREVVVAASMRAEKGSWAVSSAERNGVVDFSVSGAFGNDSSAIADDETLVTTIRLASVSKGNLIANRASKCSIRDPFGEG